MDPDRWQKINQLFHSALEREADARAAFLAEACTGDDALRLEVESLIESHEQSNSFIEAPASDLAAGLLTGRASELNAGQVVGPYKILSLLGEGGMGEVYLAQDARLGRQVALKRLPAQFALDADRVRRFEHEARAVSALNHPNIVTIHEIGRSKSLHFITTEFIDGETLRQHLSTVRMKLDEVLDVATQIASALAAAHAAGIVHRDIKPENIMIRPDGYVKVLDFGLAKLVEKKNKSFLGLEESNARQTARGLILGTVSYMSPEQAKGEPIDERSDIFSLGAVIHEMIAGRTPFAGDSMSETFANLINAEPQPLTYFGGPVPDDIQHAIQKMLRKDQNERYQTMNGLLADLKDLRKNLTLDEILQNSHPVRSKTTTVLRANTGHEYNQIAEKRSNLVQHINRHKRLAALALATFLIVSLGAGYYFYPAGKSPLGAGKKSIAVLPLKPINTANRDEIYEIGIADSLILKLGSMNGFVVRSLSATRKYADIKQDPIAAGREQQVDYVLASNYQLAEGKIRVTSQLLNVASGQIEETYISEKDAANVFVMQDAIAGEVGNKLLARFATSTSSHAAKRGTTNEEAYRLYLQGMYLYGKRTERASKQAVALLEQAVKLDPNYALAWAGKAHAHRYAANLGRDTDTHGEYQKSVEAINKALQLDQNLSEAYSARCENKYYYEFDFAGAEVECKRAIELDPNSSLAHEIYGRYLYHRGRFADGISELKAAIDLEPTSLFNQRNLGIALYYAGHYDEAKAQFKRVIAMDENFSSAYSWLRNIFELQGNHSEAFEWFMKAQAVLDANEQTIQLYNTIYQKSGYNGVIQEYAKRFDDSINQFYVGAILNAQIGNKDKAFEYLEKAYQRREWGLNSLLIERRLDPLRDDPRFHELVKRVELK